MHKPLSRRHVLRYSGLGLAALAAGPAFAQAAYPDRPLKRRSRTLPGSDPTAWLSCGGAPAPGAGPARGGREPARCRHLAGCQPGCELLAHGYNLLVATTTTLAISPSMYATPPAVAADFVGVAMIGSVTLLLVTRPDLKVNNLAELVAAMRNEPGKFNFGSPGNGSMHHLIIEMIKSQEKVSATHVPYQGSLPALTDLMAGRIDFMFLDAVAGMPHIQANKVGVIAISASRRLAALPQVATVAETYPKIDIQAWQAIAAPRDTPAPVVARLNAEINKMLEAPEVRATLLRSGVEANPMSVQALNDLIVVDNKRFGDLVRAAGVKAS